MANRRRQAKVAGLLVLAACGWVAGCSSAKDQVSAGPTTMPSGVERLSCDGGGFSGISPDFASTTGEATPDAAVARYVPTQTAIPADGYVEASNPSTVTTQVPTRTFVHLSGEKVNVQVRVVSLDGSTWLVDGISYCE